MPSRLAAGRSRSRSPSPPPSHAKRSHKRRGLEIIPEQTPIETPTPETSKRPLRPRELALLEAKQQTQEQEQEEEENMELLDEDKEEEEEKESKEQKETELIPLTNGESHLSEMLDIAIENATTTTTTTTTTIAAELKDDPIQETENKSQDKPWSNATGIAGIDDQVLVTIDLTAKPQPPAVKKMTDWLVVPSDPTTWIEITKQTKDDNLVLHIVRYLEATNVYWRDLDWTNRHVSVKFLSNSKGTNYGGISVEPSYDQRFMGKKLPYGQYILFPPLTLTKYDGPPHGNLDHVKDPNNPNDCGKPELKHQCKVGIGARPGVWNLFNQSPDGTMDTEAFLAFMFIRWHLELRIAQEMQKEPKLAGTFTSCTGKGDELVMYADTSILRTLQLPKNTGDYGAYLKIKAREDALFQQLKEEKYKAYTDLLTRLCLSNTMVLNEREVYRFATLQEHNDNPSHPKLIEMDWTEQSMIKTGDSVMPLCGLTVYKKERPKTDLSLKMFIWLGSPDHNIGRKDNTLQEFLKHVPTAPAAPAKELFWDQNERSDDIETFAAKVIAHQKEVEKKRR